MLSGNLAPHHINLAPFLRTGATVQEITIRRGSQTAQSTDSDDFQARFAGLWYTKEQLAETTDVSLEMRLRVCEYAGFLEFIDAEYELSGQVGNFRVDHQHKPGDHSSGTLSLTYQGRDWMSADGGQFVMPRFYGFFDDYENGLGLLDLRLQMEAEPFVFIEGDAQLLVDVLIDTIVLISQSVENQ